MHHLIEGYPLIFDNKEYKVGDQVPVTNADFPLVMKGTQNAIEELIANIISLYTSIHHLEELLEIGLLEN